MKPLWYRSSETALIPLKWNRSDTAHVKPDWNRSMKRLQHGYDTTQWNQFQVSGSDTALSRINETAQMKPSGYQLETAQSRLWLLGLLDCNCDNETYIYTIFDHLKKIAFLVSKFKMCPHG